MPNFPAPTPSWSDVARLCRRVCVLREQGRHDEAEILRSESLAPLVAQLEPPADSSVTLENRLTATFAAEADRVANAAVLAELLAPLLGELVRPAAAPLPVVSGREPALPVLNIGAPPVPPRPVVRAATSIADFIDDMLAQESPPDRTEVEPRQRMS